MRRRIVVASICHGPAAFLSARKSGRPWPFAGFKMVTFTNAEEEAWLKGREMRWTVEDAIREAGARWTGTGVWGSKVVRDRNVITAQNAASVKAFTRTLIEALNE